MNKEYKTELDKALQWLVGEDISAYEDAGRIYVQIDDTDLEISFDEINYRAELQIEYEAN